MEILTLYLLSKLTGAFYRLRGVWNGAKEIRGFFDWLGSPE